MRFSTKILLLTLLTTLGLATIVLLVVRAAVTQSETRHAYDAIGARSKEYFAALDQRLALVRSVVSDQMEDPDIRARLDSFLPQASPADREMAEAQVGQYTFGEVLHRKLDQPAFQVLVNAAGKVVVNSAPADEALEASLRDRAIDWHVDQVLQSAGFNRDYLWLDEHLYQLCAVPIRQTQDEPPAWAFVAGYAVTDEWVQEFLPPRAEGVTITAWFVVNGEVVARGSDSGMDQQLRNRRINALLEALPADARPAEPRAVEFQVEGERYVGQYTRFQPAAGVVGYLALASSLEQALTPLRQLERTIGLVTLTVAALAIIASRIIARRLARPVEQLVAGTQKIARGQFDHQIDARRRDELGTLARSFNEMAVGLAQRDLIKDTLGQFVDPRIADALLTNPASLRGRRVVQSVLFSDLEKFTSLSERLAPEALVQLLNRFLGASADVVKELNGYLDKFTGDGVIAFWGPPVEVNHSLAACRAALRMVELTRQFTDPPLNVRIGIATGEVLVGIVGSESSKKNYTAMGDVVNLASRLEGANKVYGTRILVDARTAQDVRGQLVTRQIDIVRVVGRAEPVELHEIMDSSNAISLAERYKQAMVLYRCRQWTDARQEFASIPDLAAAVMARRCERFEEREPDHPWDGVWNLDAK